MTDRSQPADPRARLMRAAGDALGSERLARELRISPRSGYKLMTGDTPARLGHLVDTRRALIEHRQRIGMLIQLIRHEETRGGDQ